jgi:hypothetical protein
LNLTKQSPLGQWAKCEAPLAVPLDVGCSGTHGSRTIALNSSMSRNFENRASFVNVSRISIALEFVAIPLLFSGFRN